MTAGPRISAAVLMAMVGGLSARVARGERPSSPPEVVNLVYTGNTGGVRDSSFLASTLSILARQAAARGGSALVEKVGPGVLASGGKLLVEPDELRRHVLSDFVAQARPDVPAPEERLWALEGERDLTFQYPGETGLDLLSIIEEGNRRTRADPTLHRVEVRVLERRTATGARVLQVERGTGTGAGEPLSPRLAWEGLWAARGTLRLAQKEAVFYSIMKPLGDGARRVALLEQLRGDADPGTTLLLGGGDEVSTVDPLHPERTSAVRALDFATLARLGYGAAIPGPRELYFGLAELREQLKRYPLPMVATNLRMRKKDGGPGAAPFPRYLILRVGDVKVGVLGLVSPDLAVRVRVPEVVSDLVVIDAAGAVSEALAAMRAAPGGDADFVVVVSGLRAGDSAAYLTQARGIDLFIGDDSGERGLSAPEQVVTVGPLRRNLGDARSPLMQVHVSPLRVGHLQAELAREGDRFAAQRLTDNQAGVLSELPRDEALHGSIVSLSHDDLDDVDLSPVPTMGDLQRGEQLPGRGLTARDWSRLVVNLLRASSDAEIAVIRAPPAGPDQGDGASSVFTLLGWAVADDRLVICELTGALLKGLALRLGDTALYSGVDIEKALVAGRPLNETERYRVVLTDSLLASASMQRLLHGVEPQGQFRLAGGRLSQDRHGRTVRLGEVLVASLRERRGQAASLQPADLAQLRAWLSPQGAQIEPRWSLGVEHLALSLTGYLNEPSNAWRYNQGGREARTTTPNNYAVLVKATLFLTYDSSAYTWDNRVIADLSYSVVDLASARGSMAVVTKAEDRLWSATELRLNHLQVARRSAAELRIVPYVIAAYDTEFTRTTNPITGQTYPRREEPWASVGLVTSPRGALKVARVGALARADLTTAPPHYDGGFLAASRVELTLDRSLLRLDGRLRYFAPTRSDTADQLGLIVESSVKLLHPLTRDLAFSLSVDLFVYRPKVREVADPETGAPFERGTSLSVLSSVGLAFDHLWKL